MCGFMLLNSIGLKAMNGGQEGFPKEYEAPKDTSGYDLKNLGRNFMLVVVAVAGWEGVKYVYKKFFYTSDYVALPQVNQSLRTIQPHDEPKVRILKRQLQDAEYELQKYNDLIYGLNNATDEMAKMKKNLKQELRKPGVLSQQQIDKIAELAKKHVNFQKGASQVYELIAVNRKLREIIDKVKDAVKRDTEDSPPARQEELAGH